MSEPPSAQLRAPVAQAECCAWACVLRVGYAGQGYGYDSHHTVSACRSAVDARTLQHVTRADACDVATRDAHRVGDRGRGAALPAEERNAAHCGAGRVSAAARTAQGARHTASTQGWGGVPRAASRPSRRARVGHRTGTRRRGSLRAGSARGSLGSACRNAAQHCCKLSGTTAYSMRRAIVAGGARLPNTTRQCDPAVRRGKSDWHSPAQPTDAEL